MAPSHGLPEPAWLERMTCPAFRYRKRSRTVADTAEEAYLRVDISCGSPACAACAPTSPALPTAPAHLLLPDASLVRDCLEVLELPQVEGVVLLSSVLRELSDGGGMRRSARLHALYADRRRRNVLFDNLHHRETAPRGGRQELRSGLAMLTAAEWYYEHLGRQVPVVVVSDQLASQFATPAAPPPVAAAVPAASGSSGRDRRQQQAQQARQEDEDAELDALLAQMDVGGGTSRSSRSGAGGSRDTGTSATPATLGTSSAAAAAADDDDAGIGALLESLGLDEAEPHAGLAVQRQQQQQQQPSLTQQQQQLSQRQAQQQQQQQQHVQLALEPGVHILSAADYFGGSWGHVPEVGDVFDSIQQSKAAAAEEAAAAAAAQAQSGSSGSGGGGGGGGGGAPGGFRPHLSAAALEAGLASGALLAGTLCVSRRVRGEATVTVGGQQLLLSGRCALNRAVHGDRVAVRLLPRERWRPAAELAGASGSGTGSRGGEEEEGEELDTEHDVLATAGDGETDVAADMAPRGTSAGDDEALDAVARLLATAAADALQPTAEVAGILQRWSGEIVACIGEEDERALAAKQQTGRQEAVLCIPTDRRLPKIRLRSRQLHRMLGQRLVLRLDGWEQGSHYPHGHLVRMLGPINSLRSETDGVLVSSGVHWQPFSEGALRELPPVASSAEYVVPPAELASRRDLRGPEYLVCSIDPPGCTDVDDALSVRWLDSSSSSSNVGISRSGSGGRQLVEVGVHIADVSYFVRQGGLLDSEAASRCTTVYLVDRRLDMLPALLSEDLCSLRGGQDRYAVSVLWTLDADTFEVLDTWFGRTLIRSRYQLEYSQAQDLMEGRPPRVGHEGVDPSDRPALQRNLRLLAALAEHRRQLRIQAGAVELESAELRFNTDPQGQPTTVTVKQEIPMMKIVAEMMILANAAVGRRVAEAFPRAALLRRHPPPRKEAFEEVAALCESLGAELDFTGPAASLSASLAAACAAAPPALASLIKSLATRAMSEAEYFCTGDVTGRGGGGMGHYGLALPYYTHFTSPIRRYADVVVHRQLLAAVAADRTSSSGRSNALEGPPTRLPALPLPPAPLPGSEVADKAAVMNERHRTAKRAQKECSDLYLLLLLHAQPHVEPATVYGLRSSALLVFVPRYHLKGVIHLTNKQGLCKPPLQQAGEEAQQDDPFVLSHRRGLTVVASGDGGSIGDRGGKDGSGDGSERIAELAIVDTASGRQLASFRPMQRVWVQLSADGSRAHGPSLRLRLLAETHPGAVEAARQEAAAAAAPSSQGGGSSGAAGAGAPAAAGCGSLPRGIPVRAGAAHAAYRPPGVGPAAADRPAVPPGFAAAAEGPAAAASAAASAGAAAAEVHDSAAAPSMRPDAQAVHHAAAAVGSSSSSSGGGEERAPAEPLSLAAQLQAALVLAQGAAGEARAATLAWQAALPPVERLQVGGSSAGSNALPAGRGGTGNLNLQHQVLARVLRRLQAKAARLQLRAGAGVPGRPRTERRSAAAAAAQQQVLAVQQLVPG